ncbi:hypothetical protein [Melittangium boletus]|uniref:Uncharacterized protein n=1 Tax=Melittangium boletus DSM 14713 TaxID=1294270 RepID=A0A250IFK0_9BACT|nr:hypothetical protein [Melittangium boletus]ATB30599.1 hypothetical protein MEBOL_004060 [Melittangium boletus DSM 14713]
MKNHLSKTSWALCTAFALNANAAPFVDTFDQFIHPQGHRDEYDRRGR